jgi:serine/threonine protein kinase/tetratricopeptide (TPR) repeat protein
MTCDVGVEAFEHSGFFCGDGLEKQADVVAYEFAQRWQQGERPKAEEYLERYPKLVKHPIAATRLIYEEFCQRRERGESPPRCEYFERFAAWRQSLEIVFECEALLEQEANGPRYPVPGQDYAGLKLLQELGRGAVSRVYLAAQSDLGNRPVVLKLTRLDGVEHLSLARIQHTHIVPLYWSEDDFERGLRILCMPYLGGMTVARLLASLKSLPPERRTGQAILAQIDHEPILTPIPGVKHGAGRKFLQKASATDAWCGIAICMAEALYEAHEAGLVHLDLKPSNVLIAADGKPLLLDFHLAREALDPSLVAVPFIGGTPQYMSPEQALALESIRRGKQPHMAVNHRSDIYSLGLLLKEMLGTDAAALDPDLRQIIAFCLKEKPEERYASALDLATDLKCYLAGRRPAISEGRGIAGRAQRAFVKSRRRLAVGLCIALAVVAAGWLGLRATREWLVSQKVASLLDRAEEQIIRGDSSEATRNLGAAGALAHSVWLACPDRQRMASLLEQKQTLRDADHLRYFADLVRIQIGAGPVDARVCAQCVDKINQHQGLLKAASGLLSGRAKDLARDMIELTLIARSFGAPGMSQAEKQLLDLHSPQVTGLVFVLLAHPGDPSAWSSCLPHSEFDYYLRGRAWCLRGDIDRARRDFEQAAMLEPAWPWPAYCLGHCNILAKRWPDAVSNFTVAMSLLPERIECRIARGQAYQQAGDLARAGADYEQALIECPQCAEAAFGRGTVNYALRRFPEAILDFERARDAGMDATKANYNLALCYVVTHDPDRALRSVREALTSNPRHEPSRLLEQRLLATKTP